MKDNRVKRHIYLVVVVSNIKSNPIDYHVRMFRVKTKLKCIFILSFLCLYKCISNNIPY